VCAYTNVVDLNIHILVNNFFKPLSDQDALKFFKYHPFVYILKFISINGIRVTACSIVQKLTQDTHSWKSFKEIEFEIFPITYQGQSVLGPTFQIVDKESTYKIIHKSDHKNYFTLSTCLCHFLT